MVKTILAVITATVFLASSAVPSSAQYYHRGGGYGGGGGWHGGDWNDGAGAALGLGLGGALATAPYYAAPSYGYAPSYFPAQKAVFGRPCNGSGRADPPADRRRHGVK